MSRRLALAALVPLAFPTLAVAQQPAAKESGVAAMIEVSASALKWSPLEIPGFLPGAELTVVSGDPSKAEAYTVRLRFPAGYKFPGHFHPNLEHLTVLSGTFLLAMGAKTDAAKLKKYGAGDFLVMPAKQPHFGGVEGATVVQLHGQGPFDVIVTEEIAGAAKK